MVETIRTFQVWQISDTLVDAITEVTGIYPRLPKHYDTCARCYMDSHLYRATAASTVHSKTLPRVDLNVRQASLLISRLNRYVINNGPMSESLAQIGFNIDTVPQVLSLARRRLFRSS